MSDSRLDYTPILFAKSEFYSDDLLTELEQVSYNRCLATTRGEILIFSINVFINRN